MFCRAVTVTKSTSCASLAKLDDVENRSIAVLQHPERRAALTAAVEFIKQMTAENFKIYVFPDELDRLRRLVPQARLAPINTTPTELAVVFGGDGTILRAAEWALQLGVPLLGVNLGHVGFLAELETSDIEGLHDAVLARDYEVEKRLVLQVQVWNGEGQYVWESFAINEVSLEKRSRQKMINVVLSVDDHPLSRWGCDGVLVTTPTGSTAYGFSAGGPVIWPDVQAVLLVPLSAHALFNRPMVISPSSEVRMDLPDADTPGVLWCDGRRTADVSVGDTVKIRADARPLLIARLSEQPFTTRLVKKFDLPVSGWRRSLEDQA